MIHNIKLAPSLMCLNWLNVQSDINWIEKSNSFDYMHIDIVDGKFAPDFTMGSSIIDTIRPKVTLGLDFHFMVEEPRSILETYQPKPGDMFTIHQECSRNLHRDLIYLKQFGCSVGVALCPATSISTLDYILDDIDRILIMSVDPGFKGGRLVPSVFNKLRDTRALVKECGLNIEIAVDGNVSFEHIPKIVASGADTLVLGSSGLFIQGRTLDSSLEQLNEVIKQGLEDRDG
ncbi:ribulose-phosphate 3-epimerase [Alphaproteobacteria bacterium]|nr:ribulose-phosphate 3-epimerase [Alphaproteobacteria bacterium]